MLGNARTPLTRRTMLASGAAMVAAPALAENCQLGPPPDKGPAVWMDMDQVEIDAAYDQDFYAPLARSVRSGAPPTTTRCAPASASRGAKPTDRANSKNSTSIAPSNPTRRSLSTSTAAPGCPAPRRTTPLPGRDVPQRRRALRRARLRTDQGSRRRSRHDGRSGSARHRLGLQERQELRRRHQPPLHRRLLVRRTSVRRGAGHRLAEGLRPARRHDPRRAVHERNVRHEAGAHLQAQLLRQVHRRDGAGDEHAAASRQAARRLSSPTAPTKRRSSSARTATLSPR